MKRYQLTRLIGSWQ